MSVYENLGNNLRALCNERGSISEVCRELGLNRQQFTKYLNGETFPREATLEKISAYFGVEDIELFKDPESRIIRASDAKARILSNRSLKRLIENIGSKQDISLEDGIYYTYFQPHSQLNWIIRSVSVLRTERGVPTFRRFTGSREKPNSAWRLYRGKHAGAVLERRGHIYLLGSDDSSTRAPSLLVLKWGSMEVNVLKGQALLWTQKGPDFCNCLMEKVPAGTGLWAAMRESGAVGLKENKVPSHVQKIFNNFSSF